MQWPLWTGLFSLVYPLYFPLVILLTMTTAAASCVPQQPRPITPVQAANSLH